MSTRLFGTDGVRGRAGTYPLDHVTVRRIGAALVRALPPGAARVLIGRDTRESGLWLERELAHGARACGAEVVSAGVDPDAGRRLPDAVERLHRRGRHLGVAQSIRRQRHQGVLRRGREVQRGRSNGTSRASSPMRSWEVPPGDADAVPGEALVDRYLAHVREALPDAGTLAGARVAVDCANGATTTVAPRLFRELGFDVTLIGDSRMAGTSTCTAARLIPRRWREPVVEGGLPAGRGVRR